jgi:sporulation protein YlmC with PRC-barrel domain
MRVLNTDELLGKDLFSKDGWQLGTIDSLDVDVEAWQVLSVHVKLQRSVLEDLRLKRPLVRTQKIRIAVEEIAGAADSVVLERPLEDVVFSGGKPAAQQAAEGDESVAAIDAAPAEDPPDAGDEPR